MMEMMGMGDMDGMDLGDLMGEMGDEFGGMGIPGFCTCKPTIDIGIPIPLPGDQGNCQVGECGGGFMALIGLMMGSEVPPTCSAGF